LNRVVWVFEQRFLVKRDEVDIVEWLKVLQDWGVRERRAFVIY